MLDFPDPPLTIGQVFSTAAGSWQWDGTKWEAAGSALTIPVTVPEGGTGSTTAPAALTSLGAFPSAGVTNASNAAAGQVGEYIASQVLFASALALTTGVAANITSISLTAGDWDVEGNVFFYSATTTLTAAIASINSASATPGDNSILSLFAAAAGVLYSGLHVTRRRFNVTATTTIYLVGTATFATGTVTGSGIISARRVR
jgi:hypothetical protein